MVSQRFRVSFRIGFAEKPEGLYCFSFTFFIGMCQEQSRIVTLLNRHSLNDSKIWRYHKSNAKTSIETVPRSLYNINNKEYYEK